LELVVDLPLWNICLRQWEGWHPICCSGIENPSDSLFQVRHQALLWWLSQWCRLHPESAAGPGGFNRQQLEITWGYHVYIAIYNGYKIGCGHEKYRKSRTNNY
jgi:hypothetical protein